jgi:hypothetical protein
LNREGQVSLLFNVEDDPQEVNNLAGLPEFSDVERGLRLRVLERLICAQVTSGIDVQAKK